jgi:hypothetical protein
MEVKKILYVVHCIDTEGPLNESLAATFERLESIFDIKLEPTHENLRRIQNRLIDLGGQEEAVAKCFSPELLKYNRSWAEIDEMLAGLLSTEFRMQQPDDFGGGWVFSWHCMDHLGLSDNPRRKDFGYGNIFNYYKQKLRESGGTQDEINWHFHPLSLVRDPLHAATSYVNNFDILTQILCRRVLDHGWFPVVNRPGFHAERPDSHAFLEQWIPFDYANQSGAGTVDQPDLSLGRFGDWGRASVSWRGYQPHHDDYQVEGHCRRRIFRCLNVGTRFRALTERHVREAFAEAHSSGAAILAFADHDYRDMRPDVEVVREYLRRVKVDYPDVLIKYAGAEAAAAATLGLENAPRLELALRLESDRLHVETVKGAVFGPQPFFAIKTKEGRYFHDNLDVIEPNRRWSYVLDDQTIRPELIQKLGVGSAGRHGGYSVAVHSMQ